MLTCSFCDKSADQTSALLTASGVNVYDTCIAVGVRTIETRDALEEARVTLEELVAENHKILLSQGRQPPK
ncbi:hypothetical protein BWR18_09980 [Tateyamaria omphalii]|uniref:Uncharacterized protein n=1 Tax=Tateyamaria omphalii TaxID=299262 RepID=A0A1P8MV39_9RHOB|nr:hypothetical protein BWR18_09980 [Tateyamaria omphalii]